jgi:hypothetical protein
MEDDKLDLFWHASLIVMAVSNCLICIFGHFNILVGFFIALIAFVMSFITWIVLLVVKIVRFRKQVKRWKQGKY